MGPLFFGVALALAATCNGAILQGNSRVKREQGPGELGKTFSLDGVTIQLNLKDDAQPWNGGKLSLKIEDLRKYFHTSPITWVSIDIEITSTKWRKMLVGKYSFEHGYTKDYELGEFKVVKSDWYDGPGPSEPYSLFFKTSRGPSDSPVLIVPKEISEMAMGFTTDKPSFYNQMKSEFVYINEYINRKIILSSNIDPYKSIKFELINGADTHNIEFKLLTSFGDIEDFFNMQITGSLFGKHIVGSMKWKKDEEKLTFDLDNEIKVESFIKIESGVDVKTDYEIKGLLWGNLEIRYEDDTLKLIHGYTRHYQEPHIKNSLTIKVVPRQSLDIKEAMIESGNEKTLMTYRTNRTTKRTADVLELSLDTAMTLERKSNLYWLLLPLFDHRLAKRVSQIRIFVDKKNSSRYSPKFKIEGKILMDDGWSMDEETRVLADTTINPYIFSHCDRDLWDKRMGLGQECVNVTVDHQLGRSLDVDVNVLGGLHMGAKVEDKDKTGHDMSILVKKGDVEILKL